MTLLGGMGEHLGTSFAIDGITGLFVESTKMKVINTGENALLKSQEYLELLESAINKITKSYPGEKKIKKKLTPKGRLIQEGKELQKWIHFCGPGAILLAADDTFYQECLRYASDLITSIVEKNKLEEIHLFKSSKICIPATPENIAKVRQGVKELLEGVTLFVEKVEKACKPFVTGAKEKTNIPQTENRTKGTKIVVATIMGKNSGNKNKEKLGRMEARISNIESTLLDGLKPDENEIEKILVNLNSMKNLSEDESSRKDLLLQKIGMMKSQSKKILTQNVGSVQIREEKTKTISLEFEENEIQILSIWEYILSENGIHGTLSSTKNNGHTTSGDGTYVVTTLKPFLYGIFHLVFKMKKVDFNNTSWYEIINFYEQSLSKRIPHIQILANLLKKYRVTGGFEKLLWELLETVEEIETKELFGKGVERNLMNVQNKLKEIIKKFYPE